LDNFINFLKKIQSDKRFKDFDEAAIKQAIVLKILSLLEWDPFNIDELQSEYMLKEDKIDFALKHKESLKVFVSVKKDSKNFKKNIEMLLGLSAQSDVKIAVFTNGSSWWFFLPLIEGSIDDKRFCTIDIQQQKLEDIDKNFLISFQRKTLFQIKHLS
jgi:predicted type IV restriction endonuclease